MPQNNFENTHSYLSETISDEELEKSVKELMRNSRADYSQVEVSVDAGNVHFTGTLGSSAAREHLNEMVRMIQGTGLIINDVTLKH